MTSLESISRSRVPRRGDPERHVPRGVAILPREVAVAAPNWQNGLPAPLARDRGAPRTQRGHPDSRVALVTRLDQVSLRCWMDTSPPRRRDTPHARDAGAERARRAWVGLSTSYSTPSCLSLLGSFTWGQCSAVSGHPAHYHASRQPAEPQHTPYEPTCAPRGRRSTTRPLPSTHGPTESTPSDSALPQAIPASLHAPLTVGSGPAPDPPTPPTVGTTTHARCTLGGPGVAARSVATAHDPKDIA